jgi:hypothetical protein
VKLKKRAPYISCVTVLQMKSFICRAWKRWYRYKNVRRKQEMFFLPCMSLCSVMKQQTGHNGHNMKIELVN